VNRKKKKKGHERAELARGTLPEKKILLAEKGEAGPEGFQKRSALGFDESKTKRKEGNCRGCGFLLKKMAPSPHNTP